MWSSAKIIENISTTVLERGGSGFHAAIAAVTLMTNGLESVTQTA